MILIGSRALMLRFPKALTRKPLDFDFICTQDEFDSWMKKESHKVSPKEVYPIPEFNKWIVKGDKTICEFEIIKPGSSNELLADIVYNDSESLNTSFGYIPVIDLLFTIKASHKFKKFNNSDSGFWKTAIDYHTLKQIGAKIRPEYNEFFKLREKESYAAQKHPKLNVSKENFFKDYSINYIWDHDSIHCSVAPNGIPTYTKYMKDNEPVLCDKDKFFALPLSVQLAGVQEEASVLALERSKIPYGDTFSDKKAWIFALSKVCSTITSGWFRSFSWDHIFDVYKLYPENYWINFQNDVSKGLIKPFTGTKY